MKRLLLIALLFAGSAQAELSLEITGNQLLSKLRGVRSEQEQAIVFIRDVLEASPRVCLTPDVVNMRQPATLVMLELLENPNLRPIKAVVLVDVILAKRWPCKKGG
jgi:hypothetical protein